MPELPEVETYVRELAPQLSGSCVQAAQIYWPRTIATPTAPIFARRILGSRFVDFSRRGKYMLLGLADGMTLIVHLRMTGKVLVKPAGSVAALHTRVVLDLDDGRHLHFHDTRKFGRIWLVGDTETVLAKLGPEPLSSDFTREDFGVRLVGRRAPIKALLLDQAILAGVGNIYADEALFLAGIDPKRLGGTLTDAEIGRLHGTVREVLLRGIELQGSSLGGSSLQNYVRPGGEPGGFQEEFQVFRRTGKPCPHCGTPIERIVLAQRSTHFCPACQS